MNECGWQYLHDVGGNLWQRQCMAIFTWCLLSILYLDFLFSEEQVMDVTCWGKFICQWWDDMTDPPVHVAKLCVMTFFSGYWMVINCYANDESHNVETWNRVNDEMIPVWCSFWISGLWWQWILDAPQSFAWLYVFIFQFLIYFLLDKLMLTLVFGCLAWSFLNPLLLSSSFFRENSRGGS